jgi:hypothetical protein
MIQQQDARLRFVVQSGPGFAALITLICESVLKGCERRGGRWPVLGYVGQWSIVV